jgi:hypothetical protein
MNLNVLSYIIYCIVTTFIIVVVGNTIHKNGRVFLMGVFNHNNLLVDGINNVLLAGYYLLNIGYCVYTLKILETLTTYNQLIETLSTKLGYIVLALGTMHFINIATLLLVEFKLTKK